LATTIITQNVGFERADSTPLGFRPSFCFSCHKFHALLLALSLLLPPRLYPAKPLVITLTAVPTAPSTKRKLHFIPRSVQVTLTTNLVAAIAAATFAATITTVPETSFL
jgi:hypothetical protein